MMQQAESFDVLEREAARIAKELDLPPCPAILVQFKREFHAPHPDLRRLATLIGTDIGLSATMLKTVNSPFYGLAKKATSVGQAMSVLGLRASANLISRLLLRRAFPAGAGSAMERFWENSTRIAGLAAAIAANLKGVDRDEAQTYVLFRDCGMLVMLRRFEQYADLVEHGALISGVQLTRVEDTRFKFNHARVACALARSWSLPEPSCEAIFHHHDFALLQNSTAGREAADRKLVAFGLLAEQIDALRLNRGLCPDWIDGERFVLDTLDIDADEIVRLATDPAALID